MAKKRPARKLSNIVKQTQRRRHGESLFKIKVHSVLRLLLVHRHFFSLMLRGMEELLFHWTPIAKNGFEVTGTKS